MNITTFKEKCRRHVEYMNSESSHGKIIFEEYNSTNSTMHHGAILFDNVYTAIAYNFSYCDILGFKANSCIINSNMIQSLKNTY